MAEEILVNVSPDEEKPTHEISLTGAETIGLRLVNGIKDQEYHSQQPNNLEGGKGGGEWGPFGPSITQIEQATWHSGRAVERLVDDPAGFFDSHMAYTMIGGQVTAAPQFNLAEGLRDEDRYLPEPYDMTWKALRDSQLYISQKFTAGQNYNAEKAYMWIRRVGEPESDLKLELCSDNAGEPDTTLQTVTLDRDDITDEISLFRVFDWTGTQALVGSTDYHLKVYASGTDDDKNHWEVGVDDNVSGAKISSNGSSWSNADFKPYYRVVDADVERRFLQFEFRGAFYAVDVKSDGTASQLYLQGDRGKGTAGSTSTTLEDTDMTWTADVWIGAKVRIVAGTGKGQVRDITDNTTDTLTVDPAWDITPDATSVYVIFGTRIYQDISPGAGDQFDVAVTGLVVMNDQVLFARGVTGSSPILRMRFNEGATPPAHEFADEAGGSGYEADLLAKFEDPTKGPLIWRVENDESVGSSAQPADWGSNLTFSDDEKIGDTHYLVNALLGYSNMLWAIKEDGFFYQPAGSNRWAREKSDLDGMVDVNNGQAACVSNVFLYVSYQGFSVMRKLAQNMDDKGPWQGAGLPEIRKGAIVDLQPLPQFLMAAVDAGAEGISSVMVLANGGWHEFLRGWEVGARVRGVARQSLGGGEVWLWTSMGSDLAFQILPKKGYNPDQDTNYRHAHEFVLDSAAIDIKVMSLPKLFKALRVVADNLGGEKEIIPYYQLDEDVGTENWIKMDRMVASPMSESNIGQGDKVRMRYRLRVLTDDALDGVKLRATVMQGWVRLPDYDMWRVKAKIGDKNINGGKDHDAAYKFDLLREFSRAAEELQMNSVYPWMHDRKVKLLPPKPLFTKWDKFTKSWSGYVLLSIVEA